jgi:Holliday junction resolvase RusA-like endonuclease
VITIWFEGAWPDLNSYIDAERSHRQQAAKIKRDYTEAARVIAQAANVGQAHTPCEVVCTWHVRDWRKDPDNLVFGIKAILDGLVLAGVLPNDSAKHIKGLVHDFVCDGKEGVEVMLV